MDIVIAVDGVNTASYTLAKPYDRQFANMMEAAAKRVLKKYKGNHLQACFLYSDKAWFKVANDIKGNDECASLFASEFTLYFARAGFKGEYIFRGYKQVLPPSKDFEVMRAIAEYYAHTAYADALARENGEQLLLLNTEPLPFSQLPASFREGLVLYASDQ